jgi:hypothetical protein
MVRCAVRTLPGYNGKEYALVADYNPSPELLSPQRGKLGLIEDPFGANPVYVGATSPIYWGSVEALALAPDGKLYASVNIDDRTDPRFLSVVYETLFVWDAKGLLETMLANRGRGNTKPLDRDGEQQIPAATPQRYNGLGKDEYFGWIYGIGAYADPHVRINVGAAAPSMPRITVTSLEPPADRVQTIEDLLNADDSMVAEFILKGFDLLVTGGYFQRYNERVQQYNRGEIKSYDAFVEANVKDALFTGFATVATFGVGSKILAVTSAASTLTKQIMGNVAGGFAAGATFETLLQAGLEEVARVTGTRSSEADFSLSRILMAGGLNGVLGGALTAAAPFAGRAFERAPELVDGMLQRLGAIVGLDAPRPKMLLSHAGLDVPDSVALMEGYGSGLEIRPGSSELPPIGGRTEIKVEGTGTRLPALVTPPRDSMRLADASAWFREQINLLDLRIDRNQTLEAQIAQAQQLTEEIMNGAVASLYDTRLGPTLRETHAQSVERIEAELRAEGFGGTEVLEQTLAKLTAKLDKPSILEKPACFIAGTLVHTDQGLVPIEQIKVGDRVLSAPESGEWELAYKRVVKTMVRQNKPIV